MNIRNLVQVKILVALFLTGFLGISTITFAQSGKIAGIISDKKSGETLIGLTVKINNTPKVTVTDVQGRYILSGLKTGKYTIDYSYLGYKTKSISEIDVVDGAVTTLDVVMEESSTQVLKEVTISVSARQESSNALYAAQKNSARVSDGISAEAIRKSPDKNTSDVLKRVSGTTIQDNKFVVVRGLSDRYNTASLDNSPLPSTEPNRKAFSFDIVPSNLVDNIIINKTATPDLPGDFAGGSVQILTKDIPVQNFLSFSLGYGYNTQSTFKNFKSGYRNATDYFGFDNGSRGLASNFPTTKSVINGLTAKRNIASIKSMNQDWEVSNGNALPNQNYQFSFGRVKTYEKSNNRLGTIFSLTYRNTQQKNADITRQYHVYDYTDDQYKFSTNVGALANFAYTFGNNKITLKNIYNRIFDDQYTSRTGSNLVSGSDNRFYAFDLTTKSLLKTTLDGEHKLGNKNSKLKWTLGFSNILNDQPDQRKVNYSRNISDRNNPAVAYTANVTTIGKENTRLFSKLSENIYSADASYSRPFTFLKQTSTFKVGASSQFRDRSFDVRFLGLLLDYVHAPDANAIRQRPLNTLFGTDLINSGVYKLDELPNSTDRYTAYANANSGYAMLDNKLSEKARLVWGFRVEQYNLNLSTLVANSKDITLNNTDILPSANFTYSLNPTSNLRASYYRTLARPEFRELAPFQYYDYELLAIQEGNPNLKRTLINNADLRYEMFPSLGQVLSVSVFYKQFDNAIESSITDYNSTPTVSYFNSKKANVFGAELELRKSLSFLSEKNAFKNTTVYTNLSLIKSKVKNPANALLIEQDRPLIGQSPYVINAGIQHATMENKLNLNLLYNRIGRRIYKAGGTTFPSVWENPRDVLDFQATYKVMKNKGEIKLNFSDLLSQRNTLYFDYDKNKKYSLPKDETISSFKPGATYSLSFSYSL